jgi:hypothetical protein
LVLTDSEAEPWILVTEGQKTSNTGENSSVLYCTWYIFGDLGAIALVWLNMRDSNAVEGSRGNIGKEAHELYSRLLRLSPSGRE